MGGRARALRRRRANLDQFDNEDHVLLVTRYRAWMHYELGDRPRAQSLHEANLQRASAAGSRWVEATTLSALGEYAVEAGRMDAAVSMLVESARIRFELGDPCRRPSS
jgi:hypothetical protein